MGVVIPAYNPCESNLSECCGWLYEDGQSILAAVLPSMVACLPAACAPLQSFVSVGKPPTTMADFVTVWLDGLRRVDPLAAKGFAMFEVRWTLQVVLGGWPTPRPDGMAIVLPSGPEYDHAASYVFGAAASLAGAVGVAAAQGTLLASRASKVAVSNVSLIVSGGEAFAGTAGAQVSISYQVAG